MIETIIEVTQAVDNQANMVAAKNRGQRLTDGAAKQSNSNTDRRTAPRFHPPALR